MFLGAFVLLLLRIGASSGESGDDWIEALEVKWACCIHCEKRTKEEKRGRRGDAAATASSGMKQR
jgi:hypothetical protein